VRFRNSGIFAVADDYAEWYNQPCNIPSDFCDGGKIMGTFTGTLDFAIQREEQAYNFYTILARKATTDEMRLALIDFAKEELKHKATPSANEEGNRFFQVVSRLSSNHCR
jgi:hypothetical protein